MKKLALFAVLLLAAAAYAHRTYTSEVQPYVEKAAQIAERVRGGVEANPVPIVIALGTFLLTVVYHKAKGKSFRESVEVAATRVTVVPAPASAGVPAAPENVVLKRAQARATRTQLLADQIGLKNRLAKLPPLVVQAEKDACFAEKAVADAKAVLGEKHKVRNLAAVRLDSLQTELATGQAELAEIDTELKKLAEAV